MKKILIFIILAFAVKANYLCSQIYTPKGHYVTVLTNSEYPSGTITNLTNDFQSTYPNAEILQPASNRYNCHSYAWYRSEGGTGYYWLNQSPDLHWYWDDGSYIETTQQYAEKVFYYDGDHSAIISPTNSSKYESKWGSLPLVRHDPNYVPYSQPSHRKYYLWDMKINGSSIIYGSSNQSYTIDHIPANASSFSFSYNTQLLTLVSTAGRTIKVKPKTSTTVGDAYVAVQINFNSGSSKTVYKNVGIGGPHYSDVTLTVTRASDGLEVYQSGYGSEPNTYYYGHIAGLPSGYSLTWSSNELQIIYSSGNQVYFKTSSLGWGLLNVSSVNNSTGVTKTLLGATLHGRRGSVVDGNTHK